jgi:hypothetical protein
MSGLDFEMESGVDLDATTDVQLVDPVTGDEWFDDKGEPVIITVISGQSETFEKKLHGIQQRYRIKAKNNTGPNKGYLTHLQQSDYSAEVYASIMVGWHISKKNGGPALDIPFTEKNAVAWCKANKLFRTQLSSGSDDLEKFAGDLDGNFTSKGSPGSTKTSKAKSD